MTRVAGGTMAALLAAVLAGCATMQHSAQVATQAEPPLAMPAGDAEAIAGVDATAPQVLPPADTTTEKADDGSRSGRDVFLAFREGLANPECNDTAGSRWRKHFRHAPAQLRDDDAVLPLFGHVVDTFRDAGLPTELALIPFIESGYNPRARSRAGPAGMWQFVAVTARNHGLAVDAKRDERMSPVASTRAASTYLRDMYRKFGNDWRLAIMAYNAGEYRVRGAMRRGGIGLEQARARPGAIPGLSPITYAYVEKLHALACLFEEAGGDEAWLARLDRPLPPLQAAAYADRSTGPEPKIPAMAEAAKKAGASPRKTHKVRNGDSLWTIARRYDTTVARLRSINGLDAASILRPGMVLRLVEDAIR